MNSVTHKEIVHLQRIPRSEVEEMAATLEQQGRRLRELEAKLLQEKQEKANLEIDFQHLLDQMQSRANNYLPHCNDQMVCG